jgi:hypothetical protein
LKDLFKWDGGSEKCVEGRSGRFEGNASGQKGSEDCLTFGEGIWRRISDGFGNGRRSNSKKRRALSH